MGSQAGGWLRLVVGATLVLIAIVGLIAAGPAVADSQSHNSLQTQSTVVESTEQTDQNVTEAVFDALPDAVLEELPQPLIESLLADIDDELADDILEELEALEEIPEGILEPVLLDLLDNIPDEVIEDAEMLVEDPPDEIPAILCRAQDMEGKYDRSTREEWGPTDVNAQVGNQRLSVGMNELGSITVFKYPGPSFSSQVKHHAMDRQAPYYGADPNNGAFLGLIYETEAGETDFDWIRDWGPVQTTDPDYADHVEQYWDNHESDTLITEFTNDDLGLTVRVIDAMPHDDDVHVRDVDIVAADGSPVTDVELVSYANFNLVDNKDAAVPTQDWCDESQNDADVSYDADADAIVYETVDHESSLPDEMIQRAGPEFSVATAMAFDGESTQYQIGADQFMIEDEQAEEGDSEQFDDDPADPFTLLSEGTYDLPGEDTHTGQVSTALTRDVDFSDGVGEARIYFGAAADDEPELELGDDAVERIDSVTDRDLDTIIDEKEEWFAQYIEGAPMPDGAPENVTKLSKRSLVTLIQVFDPYTENEHGLSGTTIAAVPTQAPYGADWVRDGAYFNYALDRFMGSQPQHDWVNQHNRWYMSLQQNPDGECPEHCHDNMQYYDLGLGIIPESTLLRTIAADALPFMSAVHEGEWAMNYYADGVPAGPLGGQVDQTAYGAFAMYDHYAVTGNESYLADVYPGIKLAADRLTEPGECVDDETRLQCFRPEDDNPEFTQSIRGGASVYMGLDAAAKAAAGMYEATGEDRYAEDALAYAQRRDELSTAMDEHYWNETGGGPLGESFYGERMGFPSARVAMSSFMRPIDHPRMRGHLESMWNDVNRSFQGEVEAGQYETKRLIGLGVAARESDDPPVSLEELEMGVEWLAEEAARSESTHVLGEAWLNQTYGDGRVDAAVSQPHTWQQLLTYMSALVIYGNETIDEADQVGYESYTEWRRNDPAIVAVETDDGVAGEAVDVTVTVENQAPVEQAYHLTADLAAPYEMTDPVATVEVGPIPAGETDTATLTWDTGDATSGEHELTVTAWKSAAVNEDGEPDAMALVANPTALADPDLRHVELDVSTASVTLVEAASLSLGAVKPAEQTIQESETAELSTTVTNVGGATADTTVQVRVDGEVVDEQTVTLGADTSEDVTFTLAGDAYEAGTQDITIVGLLDDAVDAETSATVTVEGAADDIDDADDDGAGFGPLLVVVSVFGAIAFLGATRRRL